MKRKARLGEISGAPTPPSQSRPQIASKKPRGGEIPGVKWPAPEPASAPGSQIIERAPERCANCGKCPRCGR